MPQEAKRGLPKKKTDSPEKNDTGKNITWILPACNILIGYRAARPAPDMVRPLQSCPHRARIPAPCRNPARQRSPPTCATSTCPTYAPVPRARAANRSSNPASPPGVCRKCGVWFAPAVRRLRNGRFPKVLPFACGTASSARTRRINPLIYRNIYGFHPRTPAHAAGRRPGPDLRRP